RLKRDRGVLAGVIGADAESLGKRVATPQNEQDCRQADCAPDFLLASEVGEAVHQARIGSSDPSSEIVADGKLRSSNIALAGPRHPSSR
ncbi:MAG TPA: hypothetical protein VN900_10685, partial [Stellaceae bacterium]|nr:hypothetical protein [Stellaceae bacterium]